MKLKKKLRKVWKKNPLVIIRITIEVILFSGFALIIASIQTYLTSLQTTISQIQLDLKEREHKIFKIEHSPRFQIGEMSTDTDSLGICISESLIVYNEGYPINKRQIEHYSFFEVKDKYEVSTIIPVKFYYRSGSITRNSTEVLQTFGDLYNCKKYYWLVRELPNAPVSYDWMLSKFHVVEIKWEDIKGEQHLSYFSTKSYQPNQEIESNEAEKLIQLHKSNDIIDMQYPLDIEKIRLIVIENLLEKYDS